VCWPAFGPPKDGSKLPQHGFARTQRFSVHATSADVAYTSVEFILYDSPETRAIWDYAFALHVTVTLSADDHGAVRLVQRLRATNRGTVPFHFTTALHTYFRTDDIARLRVSGLTGFEYGDKNLAYARSVDTAAQLHFAAPVDRVYTAAAAGRNRIAAHELADGAQPARMRWTMVADTGFTEYVTWNPWENGAKVRECQGIVFFCRIVVLHARYAHQACA